MSNDYSETQARLDAKAKADYDKIKDTLTPQQRAVILKKDVTSNHYGFGGVPLTDSNAGISITKNSHKQEPNAHKVSYDGNGNPDIGESFNYSALDSREDLILECINFPGMLDPKLRRNLKSLWIEFDFNALQAYSKQLFTKFANMIRFSDNPKLALESMFKASGVLIDDDMESGEILAKRYGITRQAVSKKVINMKRKLGLPDNTRDSKNSESRETYKRKNHRNTKI